MATTTTVRTRRHRHAWRPLLIGIATLTALFVFNYLHPAVFDLADLKASDLRMYVTRRPPLTGAVVIAAIDEKSIAELGHWPWPRSVEARLNDALRDYKVAVVGYDVLFSEPDEDDVQAKRIATSLRGLGVADAAIEQTLGTGNDLAFAGAVKQQGSTFLSYAFEKHFKGAQPLLLSAPVPNRVFKTQPIAPPPLAYNMVRELPDAAPASLIAARAYLPPITVLNGAARGIGYVDYEDDSDGVSRTEIAVIRFGKRYCVPLYLALSAAYLKNPPLRLIIGADGVRQVTLGDEEIPVDEIGRMLIDFRGPPGTFPAYSIADLIAHHVPPAAVAGKIVLVGLTAHALGDRKVTPVSGDFPGVEIHANAIDNVLRGDFVRRSRVEGTAEEEAVALVLVLAISVAAAYLSPLWSAASALWVILGFSAYAQYRVVYDGVLIDMVLPLAAALLTYTVLATYRFMTEGREKRFMRSALEHYLNPDVVESVVDDPGGLRLSGERRHLAILFSDIVNFTSRAERFEAERLVSLLNAYMNEMCGIILDAKGTLDKLMGDGIMAFWGAPNEIENPARAAIDCALKMLDGLQRLRHDDERFADVDIGIGIATGDAIVGNLGSEHRFDYSAVGDTVNLASRLEGLTRHFHVHLLVNRQTLIEAAGNYCAREVGLVKVKGKEQLVPIVDVAGHAGNGIDLTFYERFNRVLEYIRNGEATAANTMLLALGREAPDDALVNLYLEKIVEATDGQPTEMVFEFETK
ncbi:MAG TPA: adenylate/guanylate cyclase domain-containing protein [Candidatus Binataceae bacterium]|nr:adenylate/guanylate cyclase domain-containing protein [Candidatus Binataceae bacterium]